MDSRDGVIEDLRALVAKQAAQLKRLTQRVAELELALAKATKDSSTSSKPPSSDITKPRPKRACGRPAHPTRGGQPGHPRQLRKPLPGERVTDTIDYEIYAHEIHRLGLTPTGDWEVMQQIELPDAALQVINHRLAVYQDPAGSLYTPHVPELDGPIFARVY